MVDVSFCLAGFQASRFATPARTPPRTFHEEGAQAWGRWHVGRDCLGDHLLLGRGWNAKTYVYLAC